MKLAIVLYTQYRERYLNEVIKSLRENDLTDCDVFCVIDGVVNKYTGRITCEASKHEQVVNLVDEHTDIFKEVFKNKHNLGVAINQLTYTDYFFNELDYKYLLHLEDDLVLSKNYVFLIKKLLAKYEDDEKVKQVLGSPKDVKDYIDGNKDEKKLARATFPKTPHAWGVGWWREKWNKMKPYFMESYRRFLKDIDYVNRDHNKIIEFYKKHSLDDRTSSQDKQRDLAFSRAGYTDTIQTVKQRAKYIGKSGLHSTPGLYYRDWQGTTDNNIDYEIDTTQENYVEL